MNTKEIGDFGEAAARGYLEDMDYEIVSQNFKLRTGEIDIIAEDSDTTVFVEVKTRKSTIYGMPAEFVDRKKQERIKNTAMLYIGSSDRAVRFDVIEVMYELRNSEMKVIKINHIKDAF